MGGGTMLLKKRVSAIRDNFHLSMFSVRIFCMSHMYAHIVNMMVFFIHFFSKGLNFVYIF